MSVIIKGLEMPKDCVDCKMSYDGGWCLLVTEPNENIADGQMWKRCPYDGRPQWCPLIKAPSVQVGQTVYFAFVDSPVIDHVVSFPIVEIRIYEDETIFIDDCDNEWKEQDFGKTVFLTYEEAEFALRDARNEV